MNEISDILIIGAGVVGAMIARTLSQYVLKVVVVDKSNDAGNATSSANSAIIHSGYDPEPGSNKAKFNVLGNRMFPEIAKQLDVPFVKCGSLTVALEDEQLEMLEQLKKRASINGVAVELLSPEEALKREPNLNPMIKGALYTKEAGIIDPFNFVIHAMENAIDNGVTFLRNHEVLEIKKENDNYKVITNKGTLKTKIVINAAGINADLIAKMVEEIDWSITPRKGEYFVLDHYAPNLVKSTIFPLPSKKGKGVLVSQTTSGNYILGPSSEFTTREDLSTDSLTLNNVKNTALSLVPSIPFKETIRIFSGLRATCTKDDFIIEYSKKDRHFIHVAGIESPGFVSSPAIAEYVVNDLIKPLIPLNKKANFNPYVKKYPRLAEMSKDERNKLIKANPDFGKMICNCEKISLGEIKEALSRSCPPVSIKGIKRRVRAGFGKCQGGFCQPKVLLILAKHYHLSPSEVLYDEEGSYVIDHQIREGL
ncbi:MAG TPA: NAD(P)/FAD-dependent oxidoreductase [Erysipelotrichaceae bacterium]|nr:NAD(P)/FAD-dependent oxidoreductase [Erysipelotrichaceae bacterium]